MTTLQNPFNSFLGRTTDALLSVTTLFLYFFELLTSFVSLM